MTKGIPVPLKQVQAKMASDSGCWIHIFEDEDFSTEDNNLRLYGPAEFSNMRNLPGAGNKDWGDQIDSLIVGPNAWVCAWEDENFQDTQIWFVPNQQVSSLNELGMGDDIDSMRIFSSPPRDYLNWLSRKSQRDNTRTKKDKKNEKSDEQAISWPGSLNLVDEPRHTCHAMWIDGFKIYAGWNCLWIVGLPESIDVMNVWVSNHPSHQLNTLGVDTICTLSVQMCTRNGELACRVRYTRDNATPGDMDGRAMVIFGRD